jgi:hypothetical protein
VALGWTFVFGMVYMPPFFIPVLLLITLIALPSAGVVASKTGGWSKLAKVYPDVVSYVGEEVVCSGGMGIANYGFSLLLGGNYTGFSMKVTPWLRLGHEPLFIPWEDLAVEEIQGLFYPRVMISFKKCPGIFLRMPKKDALKVKALAGSAKAFQNIS